MNDTRWAGLQTIFGFFLGLMVTAFVGVAIYTFYPPPNQPYFDQMESLRREQQKIRIAKHYDDLTSADRARIQEIEDEIEKVSDARAAAFDIWERHSSMILIALATLAMVISLVKTVQLAVISNGLLLGGLFTMLYGVGWIIASDETIVRFVAMTVALIITLGLGYMRFARRSEPAEAIAKVWAGGSEELAGLEQRVSDLEDRMSEASKALGRPDA